MNLGKSANHYLLTRVPTASSDESISEARERIIDQLGIYQSINYVYVLSRNKTLVGVLTFKQLLTESGNQLVGKVSTKKVTYSHLHVRVERIAHLAIKHNFKAIPIVGDQKEFLGVIPADVILEVLYREHKMRTYRNAGIVAPLDYIEDTITESVPRSYLHRIPWIIIGIIGGVIIARLISIFEITLERDLTLAAFIPLIVYISSAVGNQTQTLFIRDMTFHHNLKITSYFIKQLFVTLLIALTSGLLICSIVILFWRSYYLGLVIGGASIVAITSSVIIALIVPYTLNSLKKDPATGSGPFGTILQDFLSILIYFLVASLLI